MKNITYGALTEIQKKLLDEAEKAMGNSYSPYSNFSVGAAILTHDGRIVTGTNMENAAYGSTVCAERAAILRANAMGYRMYRAVAIIAKGRDFDTQEVTAPCGSCRQMLYESSQISECDLEIIMSTTNKDKIIIGSIGELLPLAFGPKELGIDIKKYQR